MADISIFDFGDGVERNVKDATARSGLAAKTDKSVIAPAEEGTTATAEYSIGDHFIRNGAFCTVTAAIAIGDTLTENTNYTAGQLADELGSGGASTLADLTDVNISNPSDGQVLKFSSSGGAHWSNAKDAGVMSFDTDTTDTTGYLLNIASGMYSILDIRKGDTVAFALKANYTFSSAGGQDVQSWGLHFSEGGSTFTHYNNFICNTSTSNTYFTKDLKKGDVIVALCLGQLGDNPIMKVVSVYNIDEILPTANGGTGNADGYIRTGKTANSTAGERATIEGLSNAGTGKNVHVEGTSNTASANEAHAEGNGNTASGVGAHAEGTRCTASGQYSHAEGYGCQATQPYAHAQGNTCVASSSAASAAGFHTTAGSANQFVVGKYNDNKSTNIFEVGIGTANNAKANGLELDTSGNLKTAGTITNGKGVTVGDAEVLLPSTVGWTGKNLLENLGTSQEINDVVFTIYDDGSVKAHGTASANATLYLTSKALNADFLSSLSGKSIILSGGHSDNKRVQMWSTNGGVVYSGASEIAIDVTSPIASSADYNIVINILQGQVCDNEMFYPMIRLATVTDSTYEPYHKSVEECLEEINDKLSYLEQSVTLSTSAATTVTFTSAKLTTSSCVEVGVSEWGLVPDDVTVSTGSCTVTLPKVDSAHTVTVRLYVR